MHLSAAAIAALAETGNSAAEAALARYEDRLARALGHVINLIDPDVIVLVGHLPRDRPFCRQNSMINQRDG